MGIFNSSKEFRLRFKKSKGNFMALYDPYTEQITEYRLKVDKGVVLSVEFDFMNEYEEEMTGTIDFSEGVR